MNIFAIDSTLPLVAIGGCKFGWHNNHEKRADMISILEKTGLYPKNREKFIDIINSQTNPSGIWIPANYIDQFDIEFLRDKIDQNTINKLLYHSNLKIEYIKNLVKSGTPITNFNTRTMIRRTYEDVYKFFISLKNREIQYTKPKNPTEKKYYEMVKKIFPINNTDWRFYQNYLVVIHNYVCFKN